MRAPLAALTLAALWAACDGDITRPNPATTGALRVSAATTGGDLDLDGYAVQVDGSERGTVGVNSAVVITELPVGSHAVELSGLAGNCTVSGDNPRSVEITAGDTARVTFAVGCVATGVAITTATTGADLDPDGYLVSLDGGAAMAIDVNGSLTITRLEAGDHTVVLSGIVGNCTLAGESSRTMAVAVGQTVPVNFAVTCVATSATIEVTGATSGLDLDADGYTVQVGTAAPQPLPVNGTVTIEGLAAGDYPIALDGVADNCTVAGQNPRTLSVTVGGATRDTARTTFEVTCVATTGSVEVTAATSGIDLDPDGYGVRIDGGTPQSLAANGTITIEGLAVGDHSVSLEEVEGNCTVAGANPRTVSVTAGTTTRDTARTTFDVSCVAASGSIQVTSATSGIDLDPDGYTVRVDDGTPQSLAPNATLTIDDLAGGDHSVALEGVAGNCTVAGANPRTVSVTTGGTTRDTAQTTFEVACVFVEKIAFARIIPTGYYPVDVPWVAVAHADGSNIVPLTPGDEPGWAPDGTRIAFSAFDCSYPYYGCFPIGLFVMQADGSGLVQLTSDFSDADPVWRPDATKIAFTRFREGRRMLYVMNADGSAQSEIPAPATLTSASHPAWSPDGLTIAFTCEVEAGNADICLINPDGTGFVRLTNDPSRDARPDWKRDGSRIAFATNRFDASSEIALMNPDGGGVTRLSPGTGAIHPAWSRDGTKLVFTSFVCDVYSGCKVLGLSLMNADGTGVTQLTSGPDRAPAWRP